MDPFLAHSSLSPSVILIPEGPQKNRWSRGIKRGCESIIKAEQWLPRACSSRSLTVCLVHTHVPSWFKAQAQISASSLPPACNPNLYTHCFHTEGCPSPLSPDTFREGESAHLGCWWGCSALSTWIWLCHCLAPKASLSRIHHVTCGQMACSSRMGTVSPPSCTALWGTGPSSVPVGFRVGHSANSQRAPGLSLYPRTAGEPGIFSPPSDACARYLSSQQIPAHS